MASLPPRTASHDWLLRATRKLENSIYRTVEFKYRNTILALTSRIKEYEVKLKEHDEWKVDALDDISRLEKELTIEQEKVEKLEEKLGRIEKPSEIVVEQEEKQESLKETDEHQERKIKEAIKEITKEQEKVKEAEFDPVLEQDVYGSYFPDLAHLANPYGIPSRPTSPPSLPKKKKRERSISPKLSDPRISRKKHEPNIKQPINSPSPPAPSPPAPSLGSRTPAIVNKKKRKRKREKDET